MARFLLAAAALAGLAAAAHLAAAQRVGAAAAAAVAAIAALAVAVVLFARRRRTLRRARARLEWGDPAGAARLFDAVGEPLPAARAYARAGEATLALKHLVALGRTDEFAFALAHAKGPELSAAVDLLTEAGALADKELARGAVAALVKAGQVARAAALLEGQGDAARAKDLRRRAATDLVSAGKLREAAEAYLALGDPGLAAYCLADLARRAQDPEEKLQAGRRAADLFSAGGDTTAAANALADAGDLDAAAHVVRRAGDALAAARLLFQRRAYDRAREAFLALGDFRQAAAAAREGGDLVGAAELFERAGDAVESARTLLQAGRPREAADVYRRSGSAASAADVLAGAGLVDEARDVLIESGDIDAAVELLVRLGRSREAAEILDSRGDARRAAVLLSQAGDLLHRAQVLEGQGDLVGAAQAYLDLGRPHDARDVLAEAGDLSPEGRFLYARARLACGDASGAAEEFARLAEQPGSVPRVDALYGLGRALEAAGRLSEAVVAFEELARADGAYRDAAFRHRMLAARIADAAAPGPGPIQLSPAWALNVGGPSQSTPNLPREWVGPEGGASGRPATMGGVPSRYRIEREVGRGGMGVVYRALDGTLGRTVALKVLSSTLARDEKAREMFLKEARAVAQLIHPNIVTLFDAGVEGTQPYLVFEFLEGASLRARAGGSLPADQVAAVGGGIADALAYAHSRGIVHRDVKPENVVMTPSGAPKLTDFGVAHLLGDEKGQTRSLLVGTPGYMAPEQIAGGEIGPWTDVYALGATLFECATGRMVFAQGDPLFHHVHTPAPDARAVAPGVPAALAELLGTCLLKDPKERPASAAEVAQRLRGMFT